MKFVVYLILTSFFAVFSACLMDVNNTPNPKSKQRNSYNSPDLVFHTKGNILDNMEVQKNWEIRHGSDKEFLYEILKKAQEKNVSGGMAVDLGSGTGEWSRHLLDLKTWTVFAVDSFKESLEELERSVSHHSQKDKLTIMNEDFRNVTLPASVDLLIANNSLGFVPCEEVKKVLEKIRLSLRTGGIFAATFWGDKDIRNHDKNLCTLSPMELENLLKDHYELLYVKPSEGDAKNLDNDFVHWHTISIIAKRI